MNTTPKRKPHGGGFLLFRPDGKQTSTGKAGNRAMITRARESRFATPFVPLDTSATTGQHCRAAATSAAGLGNPRTNGRQAAYIAVSLCLESIAVPLWRTAVGRLTPAGIVRPVFQPYRLPVANAWKRWCGIHPANEVTP